MDIHSFIEKTKKENENTQLKCENKRLDDAILRAEQELEKLNEEAFEVKVQRIAMGEIAQTTEERLFRQMGYVESFHGYPDMGNQSRTIREKK